MSDGRAPLATSTGGELRALLAPVTPEAFVRDYWGRRPLFVKGFAGKYAGFFGREAFWRALASPGPTDFLRASFDKAAGSPKEGTVGDADSASIAFGITPEQAVALFQAGATLCATQVEARTPSLAPFVAAIKRQLGYPGRVTFNAYLSPPGSGFNWHWDSRIASTLQIEGSKTWRFSNQPAVPWPRGNGVMKGDKTGHYVDKRPGAHWEDVRPLDENDTTEVLLEPGDLLILPAGAWHDARGGEGGSLALNLSFTPISYTVLVRELLELLLSSDADWRAPFPLLPRPGGPAGEVDEAGLEALSRALAKASDALRSPEAEAAMIGLWSSFVQASGMGGRPVRAPDAPSVKPGERLKVRADGDFTVRLSGTGDGLRLSVFVGTSGRVDATGKEVALLQRIFEERAFQAKEAAVWAGAPWDETRDTLTHLVREGVLERE